MSETYIAMWSGPRNISTAMMRSWENRPDAIVVDEPFYGFYLHETGLDHPGAADIMASYPTQSDTIIANLTAPLPAGTNIFYQKHMTHHMLPNVPLDWLAQVVNCFLIREPREVITSYIKVRPDFSLDDLGFTQQYDIFKYVKAHIDPDPLVLDTRDVLLNPAGVLQKLCERAGVPFSENMLSWPAGRRDSDGVWAPYWYSAVEQSTAFAPYTPKPTQVPERYQEILTTCEAIYEEMASHRLTI